MRKAWYHFFKTREVGRGVGGGGKYECFSSVYVTTDATRNWIGVLKPPSADFQVKIYIRSKYQYCTNLGGFKTGGAILRNHRQFYLEQDNMN